jgi:hypothetical protein
LLDARKGLRMFQKVNVPVLGIVENMSTHVCSSCGHEEPIFGTGGGERLAAEAQVELLGQLPLDARIREEADGGRPTAVAAPATAYVGGEAASFADQQTSIGGSLPLALLILWMMHVLRRDLSQRPEREAPPPPPPPCPSPRDDLAEFKLEVARTYVPLSVIRDLDARLTRQLDRFEEKLDEVSRAATAAAAVAGRPVPPRGIGFALRGQETDA